MNGDLGQGQNGVIDEISVFNKALSLVEIQQLYNLGYTKFNNLQATNNNLVLSGTQSLFSLETSENQLILQGGTI
jgi:hypothetical protein